MKSNALILHTTKQISDIMAGGIKAAKKAKHARYMRTIYRPYCAKMKKMRIECRLSSEQSKVLENKSKEYGLTKSECLREAAFAHMEKQYLVPDSIGTELSTLVFLFRNMACNINQIAKHANTYKKLKVVDVLTLSKTVQELERLVTEFVENPTTVMDDC